MIYAVHISDSATGLEKIVTVEARTPEEACRRIERVGCRILNVKPAQPGINAGVVMNPPASVPEKPEPPEARLAFNQRKRDEEIARMVLIHNLTTLAPIIAGIASILWGFFKWQSGNNLQAFISAVFGVILSLFGALRRWTRDQGPWR